MSQKLNSGCATLRRLPGTTTAVALENGNLSKQKEIKSKLDSSTKVMHVRSIAQVMHVRKDLHTHTYIFELERQMNTLSG
jgi:hypothetical protein